MTLYICQYLTFPETDVNIGSVGAAQKVFPDSFFEAMVIRCLPLFSSLGSKPIGLQAILQFFFNFISGDHPL